MRWFTLLVMALALVATGCGGSDTESTASDETTIEETVTGSPAEVVCPVLPSAAAAMYVGWSIWRDFGYPVDSEDANKVPDEIKADVESLAQALVKYSAKFEDQFPPEDLGIPPGDTPLDNEQARFAFALGSMDQEELTLAFQRLEAWAQQNCAEIEPPIFP